MDIRMIDYMMFGVKKQKRKSRERKLKPWSVTNVFFFIDLFLSLHSAFGFCICLLSLYSGVIIVNVKTKASAKKHKTVKDCVFCQNKIPISWLKLEKQNAKQNICY